MKINNLALATCLAIAGGACGRAISDLPSPVVPGEVGPLPTPQSPSAQTAPMQTLLATAVHSSAQVSALDVTVTGVDAHIVTAAGGSWTTLVSTPQQVNLVQLANNATAALGSAPLPTGQYDQVRLILATAGTITVDGTTGPLGFVASEGLVGWKIVGGFTVVANTSYVLTLDLDLPYHSLHQADGGWVLDPTVKLGSVTALPGGI